MIKNKFLTKNSIKIYKTLRKIHQDKREYPIHTNWKEIQRRTGLTKPTIFANLNTLEEYGFITRIAQNPPILGSLIYIEKHPLK